MSDLHGYYIEDLSVGQSASYAKTVTEADVILFAGITGDDNPVHINQEFAETTMFKGRIVHGIFCGGLISTVAGTRLPGPGAIYIEQSLKFKAPVRIGDTVTATVTVTAIDPAKRRVTLETLCAVGDTVVIKGEAQVLAPSRG